MVVESNACKTHIHVITLEDNIYFWKVSMKLKMVDFQPLRTNQALEVIMTLHYINRCGNEMIYTIGRHMYVD